MELDSDALHADGGLAEADAPADPLALFSEWLGAARAARLPEPGSMTLATVDERGAPSARVVLLKGLDERGFTFYTNHASRKARELEHDPRAALCFLWKPLERQVRVEGHVARISGAESDAYFASRPRDSQLGAWASPQSRALTGRAELEARLAEVSSRFADAPVPRPDFWGGYRLRPARIEFWHGRRCRLHDRLVYSRTGDGPWSLARLAP